MTEAEFKDYFDGRYTKALGFYDRRSRENKLKHRIASIFVIVASAVLAPSVIADLYELKVVAAVLSVAIVIAAGIAAHCQFQENWLRYRSTWDGLQREPHLRTARLGEYGSAPDPNAMFVQRVETLLTREGGEWLSRHSSQEPKPKPEPH